MEIPSASFASSKYTKMPNIVILVHTAKVLLLAISYHAILIFFMIFLIFNFYAIIPEVVLLLFIVQESVRCAVSKC